MSEWVVLSLLEWFQNQINVFIYSKKHICNDINIYIDKHMEKVETEALKASR